LFVDRGLSSGQPTSLPRVLAGSGVIVLLASLVGIGLGNLAGAAIGLLPAGRNGAGKHFTRGLGAALAVSLAIAAGGFIYLAPRGGENLAAEYSGDRVSVIHVGLDGGCWNFLLPLVRQGKMPNLKRIMEEGVWGGISTTYPWISPMIWTTVATGKRHERHGIRGYKVEGERNLTGSLARREKTVWDVAGEQGRRVCVVDWMATWPPDSVNGYLVTRLTLEERDKTSPRWLQAHIESLPAWHQLQEMKREMEESQAGQATLEHTRQWAARARADLNLTRQLSLDLLDSERFDYFAVYEHTTDELSHAFWPQRPGRNGGSGLFGKVLEDSWAVVDSFLGDILDRMDSSSVLIVNSDHGLVGVSGEGAGGLPDLKPFFKELGLSPGKEEARRAGDWVAQKGIAVAVSRRGSRLEVSLSSKRRGGKGGTGEPGGPMAQKAQRDSLARMFRQMVAEEDGQPVFAEIRTREGEGEASGPSEPDLVLVADADRLSAIAEMRARWGERRIPLALLGGTEALGLEHASHWKEGIFLAVGNSIRRGAELRDVIDTPLKLRLERCVDRFRLYRSPFRAILVRMGLVEPISVFDVASTAAYALGLPLSADSDGELARAVFTRGFLKTHPVVTVPTYGPRAVRTRTAPVSTGEEEYKRRLRAIGYIE
jgi:hypothetical protein